MGCDIRMVGAYRWRPELSWQMFHIPQQFQHRNYAFFAGLANVRNCYDVKPLQKNRGIPDFFAESWDHYLGDHSFGWCTLFQFKSYNWTQLVVREGIVTREFYEKWDGVTPPESYCGGIYGPGVSVCDVQNELLADTHTHARIHWTSPLVDKKWIDRFIDFLEQEPYPDLERVLIFGFDS